jgi:FtsP/CotA-like multicopper oxidase with cupredoxin domain
MTTPLDPPQDAPIDPDPPEATSQRDGLFAISIGVALLAMLGAVIAIGFGWRAIDESEAGGGGTQVAAGGGAEQAMVSVKEFSITPASVGAGGSLHVMDDGSIVHNVAIEDTELKTADIGAGESDVLELGDLAPGTYTMFCDIPGHRDAGMEAELTITEGGGGEVAAAPAEGADHSAHSKMDYQKMTDDMLASMNAFPAKTKGQGNAILEPTEVQADGTKVFDLTMETADWEVEPGKVVEAWTFNGMVPAPLIKVEVGDKVKVRIQNDLPLATDVHWHGLKNDNAFDGVAPFTQDLIEPGESFTYEVKTVRPAVSMYHPHAHGHMLLPNGMFGGILVGEMPLPLGRTIGYEQVPAAVDIAQEIPMVLNDSGVIGYSLNGKSFPATEAYTGKVGDWLLVHYFNEGNQIHPMHLHQFEQIVVAKDGSPLNEPYAVDTLNVAPGERYSVLVHLDKPGTWVWHCHILPHVERDAGMFGMVTAVIVKE